MMKTMFGGAATVCAKRFSMPDASAIVPRAAPRSNRRRVISCARSMDILCCRDWGTNETCRLIPTGRRSPAQVHPHAEHRAARIHEGSRLTEIRAEHVVGGQPLFRCVVERIEQVDEELEAAGAAERDCPREAQIEQRLRR